MEYWMCHFALNSGRILLIILSIRLIFQLDKHVIILKLRRPQRTPECVQKHFCTYQLPSHCVSPIHIPTSWTPSFQAVHFVIIPLIYFQGLLNTTFWHPYLLKRDVYALFMTDATSQNSCWIKVSRNLYRRSVVLLPLNMGRNFPTQFIPNDVFLHIRKLIISLFLRPPHKEIEFQTFALPIATYPSYRLSPRDRTDR